jgi:hypothetical protein
MQTAMLAAKGTVGTVVSGLESRCAVIRTVGSNPTLSASGPINLNKIKGVEE